MFMNIEIFCFVSFLNMSPNNWNSPYYNNDIIICTLERTGYRFKPLIDDFYCR